MKFTCTQENFLRGLSQVVPIAGRNSQLPTLQYVLLRVKDNSFHLTTTDLEVGVHTIVGGKVEEGGSVTVPAKNLLEYVQQLPSANPITVEQKGSRVIVQTSGFYAEFPFGNADDFPLLPTGNDKEVIHIPALELVQALQQTLFAAAREETRPEIRSVYLHVEGLELALAATDSFRLVESIITLSKPHSFSLLLPLPSAQEVTRLFAGSDELEIVPHENHVVFRADGIELSSRLVDGNYPDYRQIIPEGWKTSITAVRDDVVRALKTLTVFLPRDSRRIHITCSPAKGSMVAQVVSNEAGQGSVTLHIEGEGDDVEVLVNVQYLLEGLQRIPTKQCRMFLGGSEDPIVFRPGDEGVRYVYVVMPIQAQ